MKLDLLFLAQTSEKMMQVGGFHYVMKDFKNIQNWSSNSEGGKEVLGIPSRSF